MYGSHITRVICIVSAIFHAFVAILQSISDTPYQGEMIAAILLLVLAELDHIAQQLRKEHP